MQMQKIKTEQFYRDLQLFARPEFDFLRRAIFSSLFKQEQSIITTILKKAFFSQAFFSCITILQRLRVATDRARIIYLKLLQELEYIHEERVCVIVVACMPNEEEQAKLKNKAREIFNCRNMQFRYKQDNNLIRGAVFYSNYVVYDMSAYNMLQELKVKMANVE
jgi:F0F1-type ATP synthase delta subunit